MAHSPETTRARSELALAVYLCPIAEGRRVLWVGSARGGGPDQLAQTARSVRVLSPDGEKTRGRARISTLKPGGLSFKPGSYDIVVVPDLSEVGMDRQERLADIAEIVGDDGLLVAGTAASDGVGYDALYDLVSEGFEQVQMLGQARFSGFTVVEFGGESDAVTVDGSLVAEDDDAPERFLAVGSPSRVQLDGYAVVRTPEPERVENTAVEPVRRRRQRAPEQAERPPEVDPDELRAARERIDAMSGELDEQRAQLDAANEHAEALETTLAERSVELERIREALEAAQTEIEQRQAEASVVERVEEDATFEFDRLEGALRDRTRELREARREIERRGVLVRDVVEELAELRRAGAGAAVEAVASTVPAEVATDAKLIAERDAAVERALNAEAARAEARFQVDELMGQLAAIDDELLTRLGSREAELSGTVRGLRARVAEVQELREIAEGRASLLEVDLDAARNRHLMLEREMGELREQLELAVVREHSAESAARRAQAAEPTPSPDTVAVSDALVEELRASERHLSKRVGELSGQLMACRDRGQHLEEERDHSRAESLRLTALVSTLQTRAEGARLGYEARIAELRHDAGARQDRAEDIRLAELRGEVAGLRARLGDADAAFEAAQAAIRSAEQRASARPPDPPAPPADDGEATRLKASLDEALDEADRLRKELEELNDKDSQATMRLADAEELVELEAARAADLTATLASRDALITRLQMDLASLEQKSRDVSQRHGRLRDENDRLREALVHASERVDDVEGLEARVAELEKIRDEASAKAMSLGKALASAEAELSAARESSTVTTRGLGELRESLAQLLESVIAGAGEQTVEITAVGLDAPSVWGGPAEAAATASDLAIARDRVRELEAEVGNRDTLLRSLTAQLEDRDDRLRALERRLSGEGGEGGDGDVEALRRELMELQERADRLSEELMHERHARRIAESEAQKPTGGANEGELKRLHGLVGERDSQVLSLKDKLDGRDRELKTMREAAVQTRAGLEELLGELTASGDPGTAERVGALLRIMSRL